jgi:hypothetical protein
MTAATCAVLSEPSFEVGSSSDVELLILKAKDVNEG